MATSRRLQLSAALVAAVIGAYWYGWSPLIAVRQMQSAAQARDAAAFNEHVDYPRLRDSLKAQLSGAVDEQLAQASHSGNEFARAGAALGAMLGHAVADRMVDVFVRPETVMRAMREGQLSGRKDRPPRRSRQAASAADEAGDRPAVAWDYEREGFSRYLAHASRPGEPQERRVTVVLERSGFATWKLTEIRLPPNP